MQHFAENQVWLGLLVLRVAVGATMFAHGYNHIYRGGKIKGTAGWFASLGMRRGILHAWFASLTELGAGAMLVLGLVTPLACAGVIGTMLGAWITNHLDKGFFVFHRPTEGYEYVMVLTAVGAGLGGVGAGRISVDHLLKWFTPAGWAGFAVATIAGFGSAVALLAVFWRPERRVTGA